VGSERGGVGNGSAYSDVHVIRPSGRQERTAAIQTRRAVYWTYMRGGPHFGAWHAELQMVRKALGDVPLVGFFAGG
jgi:small ligand-binding sensory domain FIST